MLQHVPLLAQSDAEVAAGAGIFACVFLLIWLAIAVFYLIVMWKVFEKANQPGWAVIVPIYNMVVMLQIAGRPVWWILLFFIPFVNLIVAILVAVDIAKNFGKGVGFAIGLILLGFIFYPILAFGDAQYTPPQIQPTIP